MTWQLLDAQQALAVPGAGLLADWDELNKRLYADHPLLASDFVAPLVSNFAREKVVLARYQDRGKTKALILLRPRRPGFWSTFLPSQAPISPALLPPDCPIQDLFRQLPGLAVAIDFLCQDPMYSALAGPTGEERRERARHVTTTAAELHGTFLEYWAARPKNLRRNMKRYFNRLEATGIQPRLAVSEDPAAALDGLTRYGLLESAGWKGAAGTAIHPRNGQGRFYADLVRSFGAKAKFRVYELYFGETLAASRLCIRNDSMLIVLKTTYDESLSQFAPGRILLYLLLEREFAAQSLQRVEFYTNANADSLMWATTSRDIYHVSEYRLRLLRDLVVQTRRWRQVVRRKPPTPAAGPRDGEDTPGD